MKNESTESGGEYPEAWTRIEYKTYPRFKAVQLQSGNFREKEGIFEVLEKRDSSKKYPNTAISFKNLSELVYFSLGQKKDSSKRYYPSAGARYPLEFYIIVQQCEALDPGVYHYNVLENTFEFMWPFNGNMEIIADKKSHVKESQLFIIATSVLERTSRKYGELARRFSFIETGAAFQNLLLLATQHGLSACILNHNEEDSGKLLDLDDTKEIVTGLLAIGFN